MPDENMSFLPEDYLQERVARRTNIISLSLFAVVMIGVVAAFFVTDRQRTEVRAQQAAVNREFEEAARRLEQLDELQNRKQQMIQKAKVTSALVEKLPRSVLLAELINHMPATLSLLELDLQTKVIRTGPRPRTALERQQLKTEAQEQEVDIPPTEMTLNLIGVAPTDVEVASFMAALNSHPLFDDLALLFSEQVTVEEQTMRKFRIEMKVNQDADMNPIEPRKVAKEELPQDPMGDRFQIDGNGELVIPDRIARPETD